MEVSWNGVYPQSSSISRWDFSLQTNQRAWGSPVAQETSQMVNHQFSNQQWSSLWMDINGNLHQSLLRQWCFFVFLIVFNINQSLSSLMVNSHVFLLVKLMFFMLKWCFNAESSCWTKPRLSSHWRFQGLHQNAPALPAQLFALLGHLARHHRCQGGSEAIQLLWELRLRS